MLNLDDQALTRGHKLKLKKQHCRLDIRKHFFTNLVVDIWNNLPERVVKSTKVKTFENRLRQLLERTSHEIRPQYRIRTIQSRIMMRLIQRSGSFCDLKEHSQVNDNYRNWWWKINHLDRNFRLLSLYMCSLLFTCI